MGFHTCPFCTDNPETSSGDVTLAFDNGHVYVVPDMILHYMAEHNYAPPEEFCKDVRLHQLVTGGRRQTKGLSVCVGYLEPPNCPKGYMPDVFQALWAHMERARRMGQRTQTRGVRAPSELRP